MVWTDNLPKETGWYWFHGMEYSKSRPRELKIIFVEVTEGGVWFRDGRSPSRIEDWPGEWAGPIPVPV